MQIATANSSNVINVDGTSTTANQSNIVANAAVVPVTIGISPRAPSSAILLPTVGTYTGTYLVAFTYS